MNERHFSDRLDELKKNLAPALVGKESNKLEEDFTVFFFTCWQDEWDPMPLLLGEEVIEDIYYARIYSVALTLFRTKAWMDSIQRKVAVIQQNYSMLSDEIVTARATWLEMAIVLLKIPNVDNINPPGYNGSGGMIMANAGKVLVLPKQFWKDIGYDLVVTDQKASVQDYLDALNKAVVDLPLSRNRNKAVHCAGCDLCCAERAPLTWLDILRLEEYLGHDENLQRLLDRVGQIVVDGPVVDITLRREEDGWCYFLDRNKRLCTIYPVRPLVCQTFICCPGTNRAAGVRKWVVNLGEDELVRRWLAQAVDRGMKPRYHEGHRPNPRLDDWRPNAYTGKKQYRQVLLKDILPPGLWKQVFKFA